MEIKKPDQFRPKLLIDIGNWPEITEIIVFEKPGEQVSFG